jgi:pimeloyl-ACP methyl ester carboxylesterase
MLAQNRRLKHSLKCVSSGGSYPPISLAIPPAGPPLPAAAEKALRSRLEAITNRLASFSGRGGLHADGSGVQRGHDAAEHDYYADVAICTKAVEYALKYRELYRPEGAVPAERVLTLAEERLTELEHGTASWVDLGAAVGNSNGNIVRGYLSPIDGSPQPYGLELPEQTPPPGTKAPLYVWLHGRGAAQTDVHFIRLRSSSHPDAKGEFQPSDGGIVLHPFGRQCVGYKNAGALDVLHAIEHVKQQYEIDVDRIVLMGFSMGGAGTWSIGSHFPEPWAAIHAGAGFAETQFFYDDELRRGDGPSGEFGEPSLPPPEGPIHGSVHVSMDTLPHYEKLLWGEGDATCYVRNLFNIPYVLAYSGEHDRQIQASRVMEQAFAEEGQHLPHIIGPGMGHAYHQDSRREIMRRLESYVRQGRDTNPDRVTLQTRTLRYGNKCHWLRLLGLAEHWRDARIDATRVDYTHTEVLSETTRLIVTTNGNVTKFSAAPFAEMGAATIVVDGQIVPPPGLTAPIHTATLQKQPNSAAVWEWCLPLGYEEHRDAPLPPICKTVGLQGPIDDAFMAPFIVITPSGSTRHAPLVDKWVEFETLHFLRRWEAVFRGTPRVLRDDEINQDQLRRFNLILFGRILSLNPLIPRVIPLHTDTSQRSSTVIRASSHSPHSSSHSSRLPVYCMCVCATQEPRIRTAT